MNAPLTLEELVAKVLSFAASDAERLRRFLDWTGLDPATIREAAKEPGFNEAVLDYAQADDEFAKVFSFATGIMAEDFARARLQLVAAEVADRGEVVREHRPRLGPSNLARQYQAETDAALRGE